MRKIFFMSFCFLLFSEFGIQNSYKLLNDKESNGSCEVASLCAGENPSSEETGVFQSSCEIDKTICLESILHEGDEETIKSFKTDAQNTCKQNKGSFKAGETCPKKNAVAYCHFPSGAAYYKDVYYKGRNIKKAKKNCAKESGEWEDVK